MIEFFSFKKGANIFMKCLFTEEDQFYNTITLTKYNSVQILLIYYYWFVYVYQATTSSARTGIFFSKQASYFEVADNYVY